MGCARGQAAGAGSPVAQVSARGGLGPPRPLLSGCTCEVGTPAPESSLSHLPFVPRWRGFPVNSLAPCPSGLFLHSALRCPQPSASPASVPCSLALLQALPFHPVFLGKGKRCLGEASAESNSGGEEPPPPPPPPPRPEWQSGSGGSHRGRLCRRGLAAGRTRSGSAC